MNGARSLHELSTQASLYIPIKESPANVPPYLALDRQSEWHNSANVASAMESITLPSRLRHHHDTICTLDRMEATLDTNGAQKIARLQCSINVKADADWDDRNPEWERLQSRDARLSSSRKNIANPTDGLKRVGMNSPNAGLPDFDLDFLPWNSLNYKGKTLKTAHTFGYVEIDRGGSAPNEVGNTAVDEREEEKGLGRKRRRLAELPNMERLVSDASCPFPFAFLLREKHLDNTCSCCHLRVSSENALGLRV